MPGNLRVLIIGAGVGGLALAQGLHRAGVEVTVCERDLSPLGRLRGYRLRLDPNGLDALDRLLPAPLSRAVWDASSTPSRTSYLNGTPPEEPVERDVSINRRTLREILLHGLDGVVEFGRECTGYRLDDAVTATFADGSTASADVLVAADGANSVIRRQYLPHARVMDTGVRIMYGRFPLTRDTAGLIPDEWFGIYRGLFGPDHQHIGIAPVHPRRPAPLPGLTDTGDYVMCLLAARTELLPYSDVELRAATGLELRDMTVSLARKWNPKAGELLALADPETLFPVFLRTSVPIEPWPTTPVTLLGDAIHAMSPAVGVGANTALRDAELLAAKLTETDLLPALRDYETAMISYGFDAVRTSAKFGALRMGQPPLTQA
ncbi:FAD-dependent monooxygenase [Amycolatopsis rubida]|uniref:FAD-dependent monooxygenase n=1 Tax=Amycolatopsis rubida TaxID=112413 RepID=A0ABX0BI46_9PSEU|nr:NAD(P)/FAD-dependent oxidoreductase [Amycolatopsis sp. M39]MYW89270.1 NAD(P)-binding protein [Amycolatopsis rubida]NEC54248.1 FAD-dependent monooxygenase [Amycolatopsis rubida]OAP29149.1 FAD-dependent urate hydroxylase [Amycolatopsis sp. M39]